MDGFRLNTTARDTLQGVRRTLRRGMRLMHGDKSSQQIQLEDLLYMAGKTLSMQDLLVAVPREVCAMLQLATFQIFLRDGLFYRPQPVPAGAHLREVRFRSSCSMLAHLKREVRPVPVRSAAPDAWTLLATGQEMADLALTGADMVLPLPGRTGLVGFATLGRGGQSFSVKERKLLQSLGGQLGLGLEAAQFQKSLSDAAVRRAAAERELELAREVQERLLPQTLPAVRGMQASGVYRSAAEVGGDYYDAFALPDGSACYVIADVSGKGVPAALLMATLRASLRSLVLQDRPLPEVLRLVNRLLYDASSASRYATLALVVYDPATGRLTSVNAGHNPPLLLQHGSLRRLECGGPVLGMLPDVCFEQEVVTLANGDLLTLYTDGVTESVNAAGEEWTEAGLLEVLGHVEHLSANEAGEAILAAVTRFAAEGMQGDDLTLLVLRRTDDTGQ